MTPDRPARARTLLATWLLLVLGPATASALGTRDAAALSAMKAFAAGKSGVVVWQTRRDGPLRIYACDLDGSNLRQVSAEVSGYDQIAPMISPDGKWIVYYQTKTLSDSTYYNDHVGAMVLIKSSDTKGATAKTLVAEVRTFFECRFARWIDNDTVAYVGKDHDGYTYSISQSKSTKVFDYPLAEFGAIPNKSLAHAIDGFNRVFQISGGKASQKKDFDGCEGNMSADNKWAYRVKGSSHDFTRMNLSSWSEEAFFINHDSALPSSQSYIYFPQISPCQKYLALGASPDQHDHFNSDYDIFIVPIDPVSFKKTGKAVKYSFSAKLDSYPDIWVGGVTPACTSDAQCDDKDPCTSDTCSAGSCQNTAVSGCCTQDSQCDDKDPCTSDACTGNKCKSTPIPGCCESDADCDDGNSCTTDGCSGSQCQNTPIAGCCKSDADCADSDACTVDTCDVATGLCANTATQGCCTQDAQCDDGDPCTTDSCDTASNACSNTPNASCASEAGPPANSDGPALPGADGGPSLRSVRLLSGGCNVHLTGPASPSLPAAVLLVLTFMLLVSRRR
jgi:hypothetical protein